MGDDELTCRPCASRPAPTVWGERLPFNTVCGEFSSPAGGWVHAVAFSPEGDALAFAGQSLGPPWPDGVTNTSIRVPAHDSTITVVYPSGPDQAPQALYTIQLPSLPCLSLVFTSATSLVAAGFDCQPFLFSGSISSEWTQTRSLDDSDKAGGGMGSGRAGAASSVGRLNKSEAFNMFRAADSRGVGSGGAPAAAAAGTRLTANGTELLTVHQNTVTSVRAHEGGEGGTDVTKISTSGIDGRLVIWDVEGVVGGIARGVGRLGFS